MSKFVTVGGVKTAQYILTIIFLFTFSAAIIFGQTETDIRPLTIEKPIERELAGDAAHSYSLALEAGQFLNVVVEQKGIDVVVTLFDSDNKKLAEIDSPNGTQGAEPLFLIIERAGNYRLQVISLEKTAPAGRYEAKIAELRTARDTDKNKIAAQKAFAEGELLRYQGTAESRRGAIEKYKEALSHYRIAEDKKGEAQTLLFAGSIYDYLGEWQKALDYYAQALPIYRVVGDKHAEAQTLNNLGWVHFNLGERQKAMEFYAQALPLRRAVGDKSGEIQTLGNIASFYDGFSEKQKALDYYKQILVLRRAIGDKGGEATTLSDIGRVYWTIGEQQKALEYLTQALPLRRAVGDKGGEAYTLNRIGWVYNALGENQKALDYYAQALPLTRAVGNKFEEAVMLTSTGSVYLDLGEQQKALEHYMQGLVLLRAVGDKRAEGYTLTNIGSVYSNLGEKQKALEYHIQALSLISASGDRREEATTLDSIGRIYSDLGEKQKALEFYAQALPLRRASGDKLGEAYTLTNIGSAYSALGEKLKALDYFGQSLPLRRASGDKRGETATLDSLFYLFASKNPRFGIFYGKQSVNNLQILRSNVQGLNKNVQQTFLKSIERRYRRLADALIKEKRYAEAQQILNAFKDQQFFDFSQSKKLAPLAVTIRESELTATLNEKLENLVAAIRAVEDFNRNTGNRQPTSDETAQLKSLADKQTVANDDYLTFLKTAEKQFAAAPTEKDKIPAVADLTEMQNALRETSAATKQNTVAVYTLLGEENFSALIITSDSIKSVSTPIKNDVLNEKAKQFWALLQSDKYDVSKLSKEIYDVVFKPIEKELPKNTKTIMWSMDGNLRYVPMAALFDGKKYLVERYNNVVFTRADSERITRNVSNVWTGTGFGSTKAQTVELLGEKISFNALPGVTEELKEIFKTGAGDKNGILKGEVLPDAKFTRTAMLDALKAKRPLVHIASHFNFQPGDEARSFLLMGDGTAFTLDEMKTQKDLFAGVELLTLSACNTAAQQADANGREVDGFAELAQRLGAGAVMATLWSVADNSTPWLMRDFYANRQNTKNGMTKADALRQAQLALLGGKAKTKPLPFAEKSAGANKLQIEFVAADETRDNKQARTSVVYINKADAPLYKKNEKKPFAHPYFWSPFILIGNWR